VRQEDRIMAGGGDRGKCGEKQKEQGGSEQDRCREEASARRQLMCGCAYWRIRRREGARTIDMWGALLPLKYAHSTRLWLCLGTAPVSASVFEGYGRRCYSEVIHCARLALLAQGKPRQTASTSCCASAQL